MSSRLAITSIFGAWLTGIFFLQAAPTVTSMDKIQDAKSLPTASEPPAPLTDEQNRIAPAGPLDATPPLDQQAQAMALYATALAVNPGIDPTTQMETLKRVVQLDPHFSDAYVRIANLLLQEGRAQDTATQLQEALKINPDSTSIQAALGYALHLQGKDEEALQLSQQALQANPNQGNVLRVILEITSARMGIQPALTNLTAQLQKSKVEIKATTWISLARLYLEMTRSAAQPTAPELIWQNLLPLYQSAASENPPSLNALILLSDTYSDLGKKTEARQALQQALNLEPNNINLLVQAAELELDLHHQTEALADYEQAYRLNPNLLGLRESLAHLYLDTNHLLEATPLLEQSLQEFPQDANTWVDLGVCYAGQKLTIKSAACFDKVLHLPLQDPEPLLKISVWQISQSQDRAALSTLNFAQARFPDSIEILYYQGIAHRNDQDYDDALDDFKDFKKKAVGPLASLMNANFYLEMALTANLAGESSLAEATLREGVAKYPHNTELMNEMAYFWADNHKNLPQAESLSHLALHLQPDTPIYLDTLGWIYVQENRTKEALPFLQRAAEMTNNDPVVILHLGEAYHKLGQSHQALVAWRRGLVKDPQNRDLTQRIKAVSAEVNHDT